MISEEHHEMLVPIDHSWKERKPQPGDRVSLIVVEGDYEKLSGCGLLIAVVGTRAQVMWSKPPEEGSLKRLRLRRLSLKVLKLRPIKHIELDIKFNGLQTEE